MTKSDHLVAYIEGVKNGDGETILRSLSDSFVLDDPDKGQISKDGFESGMSATGLLESAHKVSSWQMAI